MSGYRGYSMSNRACAAYDDGRMPLSAITGDTLRGIVEGDAVPPVGKFKAFCAARGTREWHHTSSKFNRTEFYDVPELLHRIGFAIDSDFDDGGEDFGDLAAAFAAFVPPVKARPVKARAADAVYHVCHFVEWGGSRRRPVATDVTMVMRIDGNGFAVARDGRRKRVDGTYFSVGKKSTYRKWLGNC